VIPSVGRIVHYRLSESDAAEIQHRRTFIRSGPHGNAVSAGQVFPMLIVYVWASEPTETTCVQGQVFLDGPDTLWVTSRQQGEDAGNWYAPPRA